MGAAALARPGADIRCVELLLAFGADPDAAHEKVGTALDFAQQGGRVASFLNATAGWPPLQIAVDRSCTFRIRFSFFPSGFLPFLGLSEAE